MNPFSIKKSTLNPQGLLLGSFEVPPNLHGLPVKCWRGHLPLDWALQYAAHHSWGELSNLIYSNFPPATIERMMILGFEPDYGEKAEPIPSEQLPVFQERIVKLLKRLPPLHSIKYWVLHNEPNLTYNGTVAEYIQQALAAACAIKSELPNAHMMLNCAGMQNAGRYLKELVFHSDFFNAIDCFSVHQYGVLSQEVFEGLVGDFARDTAEAGLHWSLNETSPMFDLPMPDGTEQMLIELLMSGKPLSEVESMILAGIEAQPEHSFYKPSLKPERIVEAARQMKFRCQIAKDNGAAFIGSFPIYREPDPSWWFKVYPTRTEAQARKELVWVKEKIISNSCIDKDGNITPIGELVREVFNESA